MLFTLQLQLIALLFLDLWCTLMKLEDFFFYLRQNCQTEEHKWVWLGRKPKQTIKMDIQSIDTTDYLKCSQQLHTTHKVWWVSSITFCIIKQNRGIRHYSPYTGCWRDRQINTTMLLRMFKIISFEPLLKLSLVLTVVPNTVNWTVSWGKKTCFILEGCNTKKTQWYWGS